jgi:hypothetical protein
MSGRILRIAVDCQECPLSAIGRRERRAIPLGMRDPPGKAPIRARLVPQRVPIAAPIATSLTPRFRKREAIEVRGQIYMQGSGDHAQ